MQLEFTRGRDSFNTEGWCLVGEDPLSMPGVSPDLTTANTVNTAPTIFANANVLAPESTPAPTSSTPDITMNEAIASGSNEPHLPIALERSSPPSQHPDPNDE
ncbi:hypothetical protein GALMADRAFT_139782 [Galerina marginata CBS 339.88]|uniref:Uncharacterized protein n=1 Tax=Galerina marginata (strain CBS 339.88) TaxID=685588 RepID=A0A067T800_GALM3|nr:hypothetical protein GALMADRAFT_139782 [Galerina marginata CBS 339.88]